MLLLFDCKHETSPDLYCLGITGGPVSDEYQFLQFHMHWGSNELEGAEHVIDGARLPGEVNRDDLLLFGEALL